MFKTGKEFVAAWFVMVFALVGWGVWLDVNAQGQAPNRREVVERVSREDPARFQCAHTGRDCEADWIVAVAQALHAEDSRWGLNGKRGNPDDISLDVVVFRIGPSDRHVQAFDICGACGGSNPQVVWNDITNWATIGQPGTAVYVRPPSGPPPVDPPPVDPVDPTPPPTNLQPVLDALATLTTKVDAVAALALAARDAALDAKLEAEQAKIHGSDLKHVELPKILEALAIKPCYAGNQSGWAGGRIRLCPE